jgi:hypothetical protein
VTMPTDLSAPLHGNGLPQASSGNSEGPATMAPVALAVGNIAGMLDRMNGIGNSSRAKPVDAGSAGRRRHHWSSLGHKRDTRSLEPRYFSNETRTMPEPSGPWAEPSKQVTQGEGRLESPWRHPFSVL